MTKLEHIIFWIAVVWFFYERIRYSMLFRAIRKQTKEMGEMAMDWIEVREKWTNAVDSANRTTKLLNQELEAIQAYTASLPKDK